MICVHQTYAQEAAQDQTPLSVIDWLENQAAAVPQDAAQVPSDEPAVTVSGTVPQITTQPLNAGAPRQIGLVPQDVTGLPTDLWQGSDIEQVITLIRDLPDPRLPAAQALLYTVLLTEALAPAGDASSGDRLALARVSRLMNAGALDPALSLIEQAGVTMSPEHFDLWMQISLLTGTEDRACSVLTANLHLSAQYDVRIFCAARARQWDNAALTFGSAQALKLLPDEKLAVLDRFLHPDAFEGAAPLPQPRTMDPLTFRLFETIGEPLPSHPLPRAYAVADLRDIAGWKTQLEAAERLTRAGALPENRLLGLYTDRQPAASGGIWDRVAALQRFETALATGSTEAVGKTLPKVWTAMTEAGLEVPFSNLFGAQLSAFDLTGGAGEIATKVAFLAPTYETAGQTQSMGLAAYIARGEVPQTRPKGTVPAAIYDAFSTADPRADLVAAARQKRLGEAILNTLSLLHKGTTGNASALRDALATFRALGLEDTARRAALQMLLLER